MSPHSLPLTKVMPKLVEVFYPEDDVTKRHNLLVSGITRKSPKPNGNYMAKGLRWKIKKWVYYKIDGNRARVTWPPATENYCGPVGVVYYRLTAA